MTRTLIDSENRIHIPRPAARQLKGRPLELISSSGEHLFFASSEAEGRVALAGRVGDIGIPDLLSFFNMFRKTGILRFHFPGGERDVYFDQGEIVSAASTYADEELGEILLETGRIDPGILEDLRQFVSPELSLGKILVENQAIAPKDLWLASQHQVEAVVYNLFSEEEGGFSFLQVSLEKEEILRLSLSTQNLIMEGLRRVDERALFMRRIHSLDAIPVLTGLQAGNLEESELRMIALIDERRGSVRHVLRGCGVGEFEGLKILYQLAEKKMVDFEDPPPASMSGELGEILSIFNEVLISIHDAMVAKYPRFGREMQYFLQDVPQPFSFVFRNVGLQNSGAVDGARILANLDGLEEGDKKGLLTESLGELVYMGCHLAREALGRAESEVLLEMAQDIPQRIKRILRED